MTTWSGWDRQFLNAAGILLTPPNLTFMAEWASNEGGSCKNNPVDLAHPITGSTRCGDTVTGFGRTQNYPSHTKAAQAFSYQINDAAMKALKVALDTGNPFQIGDRSAAVAALDSWGSPVFAKWYMNATTDGGTGTGGAPSTRAPHTHSGYHDLQRTMQKNLPTALRKSSKLTNGALRSLSRGRKVKG